MKYLLSIAFLVFVFSLSYLNVNVFAALVSIPGVYSSEGGSYTYMINGNERCVDQNGNLLSTCYPPPTPSDCIGTSIVIDKPKNYVNTATWTCFTNPVATLKPPDPFSGKCGYIIGWNYDQCPASDQCETGLPSPDNPNYIIENPQQHTPNIVAGKCSDIGCTRGGVFKVCCNPGDAPNNPTGYCNIQGPGVGECSGGYVPLPDVTTCAPVCSGVGQSAGPSGCCSELVKCPDNTCRASANDCGPPPQPIPCGIQNNRCLNNQCARDCSCLVTNPCQVGCIQQDSSCQVDHNQPAGTVCSINDKCLPGQILVTPCVNTCNSAGSCGTTCTPVCRTPPPNCPNPGSQGQACVTQSGCIQCQTGLTCQNNICTTSTTSPPVTTTPAVQQPTCGSSGQSCCPGNTCNAGLVCQGGVCVTPSAPTPVAQPVCTYSFALQQSSNFNLATKTGTWIGNDYTWTIKSSDLSSAACPASITYSFSNVQTFGSCDTVKTGLYDVSANPSSGSYPKLSSFTVVRGATSDAFKVYVKPLSGSSCTLLFGIKDPNGITVDPIFSVSSPGVPTVTSFDYFGDKSSFTAKWEAFYPNDPTRKLNVECGLNCDPTTTNCAANVGQGCLPYPVSHGTEDIKKGSCQVTSPVYDYVNSNTITCLFYDPTVGKSVNTVVSKNFKPYDFSVQATGLITTTVGSPFNLVVDVANLGLFKDNYKATLTSASPQLVSIGTTQTTTENVNSNAIAHVSTSVTPLVDSDNTVAITVNSVNCATCSSKTLSIPIRSGTFSLPEFGLVGFLQIVILAGALYFLFGTRPIKLAKRRR